MGNNLLAVIVTTTSQKLLYIFENKSITCVIEGFVDEDDVPKQLI